MSDGPAGSPLQNLPLNIQNQVQAEVSRQALARTANALEGAVPPDQVDEIARRVIANAAIPIAVTVTQQAEFTSFQHSGVIPHPQILGGLEQVKPGLADRVVKMAEKDQDATISYNRIQQWQDIGFKVVSLAAGVVGLGLILYVIVRLAEGGHEWTAGAVAGMGAVGIISTFVNARHDKKDPAPPAVVPANPQGGA